MFFILIGHFKPGVEERHRELRESYNEHVSQRRLRVKLGGPLRSEDGRQSGVFLIIDAEDQSEARTFVHASPYGPLYASVDVFAFTPEVGRID